MTNSAARKYNYSKLRGRMQERGYTQKSLANAIGISECSLNLKLRNKGDFRQNEIVSIMTILGLPDGSVESYFFATKL